MRDSPPGTPPDPPRYAWFHFVMWGGFAFIFGSNAARCWMRGETVQGTVYSVFAAIFLLYVLAAVGSTLARRKVERMRGDGSTVTLNDR